MPKRHRLIFASPFLAIGLQAQPEPVPAFSGLTLFASFDNSTSADFAVGDDRIYTWTDRGTDASRPGLPPGDVTRRLSEGGRVGGCLEFTDEESPWVFFNASKNLAYSDEDWSGSVSLWLQCDPVDGLAPGYCDPIQITPRQWNDAAFFLDFNKEGTPRDFRLGAFADLTVWNPDGSVVPESDRPLLKAVDPQFALDRWTHVVFTWDGYNTGSKSAKTTLFIDGRRNGALTDWNQRFTWESDETARVLLGLHFIGKIDELALFDRALSAEEAHQLYSNPQASRARSK